MSLRHVVKRFRRLLVRALLFGAAAAASISQARATLLASTFGPGDTFSESSYLIGNSLFQQEIAAVFTPAVTSVLDTVRVAASFDLGLNNFTVNITSDISGEPGTPLESFTGLVFPGTPAILTLHSASHPIVLAGSRYWIVMTAPDLTSSEGKWHLNDQGFNGVLARNFFGGFVWTFDPGTTPAFDITGTTKTPEPSTFALGLAGLVCLMRLRFQADIDGTCDHEDMPTDRVESAEQTVRDEGCEVDGSQVVIGRRAHRYLNT
jgi:hypothetical protein